MHHTLGHTSWHTPHASCTNHTTHTYYIKVTWLQHCIRQHITHHGTVHAPYHDHPTVCHRAPHIKAPCTTNHARLIPMCSMSTMCQHTCVTCASKQGGGSSSLLASSLCVGCPGRSLNEHMKYYVCVCWHVSQCLRCMSYHHV